MALLARPHPARHRLLPPPRHRRDHQRELRRRMDRAHHRALRLRHGARLDVERRQAQALLQLVRDDEGRAVPAGFTLDGPRGPARVAQPGAVWLARATGNPLLPFHLEASRGLDGAQLGPDADSQAVQHGGARGRRTAVRGSRTRPTHARSRRRRPELERRARGPRDRRKGALDDLGLEAQGLGRLDARRRAHGTCGSDRSGRRRGRAWPSSRNRRARRSTSI